MARRFRLYGEQYFEFITTPRIEPANNLAEQTIRFIVIDRHVTQGTRNLKGRKTNERLWRLIAISALQGRSAYKFSSAQFKFRPIFMMNPPLHYCHQHRLDEPNTCLCNNAYFRIEYFRDVD